MDNFNNNLKKYASLAVKVGVNIQNGQTLIINSPIECAEFTKIVAKCAYENGAKNVHVRWSDEDLALIKYLNAPDEAFNEFPKWEADGLEELAKNGAAVISISASNPELLKDVDPKRIAAANKARSLALKNYREYIMNSTISWCVVSIPTKAWAKKVFSDSQEDEAVQKLWDNIFKIVRIDKDDPVKAWDNHLKTLNDRVEFLNNKNFKSLHFKSSVTDLTIDLPKDHLWAGGGEYNANKTYFVANLPTEEVFTMPLKTGLNGTVKNTKPFNYAGNLIDNFTLTFEKGKVIDFKAEVGHETLKKLLETDEGASFIGEVALVAYDSPISNSNIVFYNTLFDENASCHLAFGMPYPTCIKNGTEMTPEELKKAGANDSLIHEDFMIGSEDMNIVGLTYDGKEIQIFENGNWVV
ncbi:MAG: aminopeptidase [Tepidibacter sp.]|jgi:aminopeptidase|uniref:aminopeptidase n=1 Tax=Tepidibacter sp. TaxID=2529387 RepID=UPI0025F82313|nr:aminopeptidase [Tepidibacter sp.]MCT4509367.1 aminopeptidase [Tepidibacter sp.]